MIARIFKRMFGTTNDRVVKSLQPTIDKINQLEFLYAGFSNEELREQTNEFRKLINAGKSLDEILPDAFAVVREASKRVLGMRHFDVQLVGGIVLHRGMVAEMKTGEGKTLVASLPVYLNALSGKGVHVVTVNDYLVKRDAEWMGKIYTFLGLTVGCITHDIDEATRKAAYDADVTYGTNNEFGFDYLRDNLKYNTEQMSQRAFNYAIVDEVDSILIDEARTPLIISGPTEDNSELYIKINGIIPKLDKKDYEVDEKSKAVLLTEKGNHTVEELLKVNGIIAQESGFYDYDNMLVVHHVNQALRAHKNYQCDVDYIIKDGRVLIIDEFTGRIMEGRRYSEGLHQALEAKEGVPIQNENQTLASITFQNYFRMYPKLAGMTGTAMTEAAEFEDIYKLQVISIPTNIPVQRKDEDDEIYLTAREKYNAIVEEIKEVHNVGQPILVGTVSIEKSEYLSSLLKKQKIRHNVLNARYHEQEAEIIAQAGAVGAVTIATNMAGRGTDIKLGGNADLLLKQKLKSMGNPSEGEVEKVSLETIEQVEEDKKKVIELGGLFVLGTERHEARRIDNQLRGRSGRQGDPGRTKFYLSLEDDLMRIFGSEKIKGLLSRLGLKDGEAIVHPWVSRSLEKAQQKVESRNYEVRKSLLRFDDVMNEQRKVIYEQRRFIMTESYLRTTLEEGAFEICREYVTRYIPENSLSEEWDIAGLHKELQRVFNLNIDIKELSSKEGIADEEIFEYVREQIKDHIESKYQKYGEQVMNLAIRQVMLLTLDQLWKEHLHTLDHLRTGIGLRAYAQKDPLNEYKMEAFNMFKGLLDQVAELVVQRVSHLEIAHQIDPLSDKSKKQKMYESREQPLQSITANQGVQAIEGVVRPARSKVTVEKRVANDASSWGKVSRNEPCPCGSGRKYKHCHGQ